MSVPLDAEALVDRDPETATSVPMQAINDANIAPNLLENNLLTVWFPLSERSFRNLTLMRGEDCHHRFLSTFGTLVCRFHAGETDNYVDVEAITRRRQELSSSLPPNQLTPQLFARESDTRPDVQGRTTEAVALLVRRDPLLGHIAYGTDNPRADQ
jgi:hypothetical protein